MPKLMWLFLIPFVASILLFLMQGVSSRVLHRLAFVLSLFPLFFLAFDYKSWNGQEIQYEWFSSLFIQFHLKIDSLSLVFLYITAIIIPIVIFSIRSNQLNYPNVFYGLVLILQGLLFGFFTSKDLAFFTFFWEAMLIPLYFIINLWGGPHRQRAAIKFIIYMVAGSTLMVAAVLTLFIAAGSNTFNMDSLSKVAENTSYAKWVLAAFILAFSVKTPLFPFHAWLPDAYYQASTAGTILLSAILSKAGIYGFLRIGLGFFPDIINEWSQVLLTLAIAGVFYGGLAAWAQNDYKLLVAYSSLSHVNFILAGLFVISETAHTGAIVQSLNHAVTITALFLSVDWLHKRLESFEIGPVRGLAKFMPHLCWLTLFFVLASIAVPGTNNFVGEILILFGIFVSHPIYAAVLSLTVILSVIYMLRWIQKIYFEAPSFFNEKWIDLKSREFATVIPLIILILWLGIYPAPILDIIQSKSVTPIVKLEEP